MNTVYPKTKAAVDNRESPHVKLKNIGFSDCRWTEGFWADKYKLCEEVMVPHMGTLLKGDIGHGLNNFKIAAGLKEGEHQGEFWHDADFLKWVEAAVYVYAGNKDETLLKELDAIIEVIGQAQEEDGYLHTYIQTKGIEHFSNRKYHEMYNCGHLYTTACVHHRLTGKTNLLQIALKNAELLYKVFQPQAKRYCRFGFNQTQIMGLVELYRTTRDTRFLELAEIFINNRGKSPVVEDSTTEGYPIGDMVQERVPLREEDEAVGHAVLALYYYAGAADVYAETGEQALIDALDRLWDNVVNKKMYVTGAVGQTHYGASSRHDKIEEGFLDEYMMPNLTAYNETCANICNSMFSFRMLGLRGESKFADVMELVLHNSGLSGISIDGTHYCYANPLRKIHGARDYSKMNTESPDRLPYLYCFCCPPNLVRTVAQSASWAYSLSENGVSVNLYGGNELSTELLDGTELKLKQSTQYPWNGDVKIKVEACKAEPFELLLRIPDWAVGSSVKVNGEEAGVAVQPGSFCRIERTWAAGDMVELSMPMEIALMEGHPRIEEVRNQAAIKRGPIVYCVESPDLPEGTSITDVHLPLEGDRKFEYKPDFLGGLGTIETEVALRTNVSNGMYRTLNKPAWKKDKVQFVPYYAWSNRGDAEMTVFVPIIWH
ncbi:beta-L-arabinofuranosidase domain-containing protein [Pelagicoccus sp. SDUM812005]|uniref:glycoside hydrolase family 127 protein n=1 Tax=Pelagicoccus sp. SDUM812005 TaxID=3041257 RepID=UPI00280E7E69|nr:beta-L-arabinofuranosidase domain-containing protein [Pelagicoccus sp. SDUM812005]MDQ8180300.1 glycoside hydrolase family 127 protein [Pelagicoccus sp. SDUM812005]